jgi:translocation and assembly module TamA
MPGAHTQLEAIHIAGKLSLCQRWRERLLLLLLSCGLFLTAITTVGCARFREEEKKENKAPTYVPPGQTDRRIVELRFKGVEQIDEQALRDGLSNQADPGWRASDRIRKVPVLGAEPRYYNKLAWERDQERILAYYRSQGFFDATVSSRESKSEDPYGMILVVTVNEGEPTRVSNVIIEGLESTKLDVREIRGDLPLKEGNIFTQSGYLEAKATVERELKSRSYAYAQVKGRVVVDPKKRTAEISIFADPGPKTVFGEVEIQGLARVDEEYVRDAVAIRKGELYSSEDIQETQENIYDLGVFSLVTVQPEFEYGQQSDERQTGRRKGQLEEGEVGALGISEMLAQAQENAAQRSALPTEVKIVIKVKEAKNWSVRPGAGFSINSNRQDIHGAVNLQSRNFFGTLGKLEQFNTLGYALTPGIFSLNATAEDGISIDDFGYRGVYFNTQLRYSQPQLIGRKTPGFLFINVERDIQEAYIGLIPSASIGLRRPLFTRKLTGEVSYNVLYILYQAFDEQYGAELLAQGLDPNTRNPSLLLEYLEQKIIYDGRDNPLNPTKGLRAQISMQEARRYIVGGEYAFLKPRIQFDGYIPLGKNYVTALRAGGGSIYNLNEPQGDATRGIPLQSRLYAGGKGSIRSFGPRYFGFFTDDLVNPAPIGSISLIETGVEQRMRLRRNLLDVGDLWGALYLDSGTFFEQQLFFDTEANSTGSVSVDDIRGTFIHGVGLGAFWLTPIGPVRADFAYTLNNIRRDFRYTADPTVVDDPDTPRNELYTEYQYAAAVRNKLRRFDFYLGIGHSF